ncbi:MAG: AbrB/MazE/SpoVT family DNA-binding domain-containing protein [Mycobacteriales bacterium]
MTIDSAGRLVVPSQMRKRFGLDAGSAVELDEVGDHIELRPLGRHVSIEIVEGRTVVLASGDVPALSAEDVRRLVEDGRK